ncbi:WG repeat-containing protein [Paenibacillus illinoisensis]
MFGETGEIIIDPIIDVMGTFSNGLALVKLRDKILFYR